MAHSVARKHQLQGSLVYHIFNRSNGKKPLFIGEPDYIHFFNLLIQYSRRFDLKIYHWVVMPTHYHLLLEITDPEKLPQMVAGLNLAYTRHHYIWHGGAEYIWQDRFNSLPIQKERYLLACGRYIERNPVRAGLVAEAPDYRYSSAAFYCNRTNDNLTIEDPMFADFGKDIGLRRNRYLNYLRLGAGTENEFGQFTTPLGDNEFRKKLVKVNGLFLPVRRGRQKERILA